MELNFSETTKSNMMSSASTLSFAAAALDTGADENDFASHLDDAARNDNDSTPDRDDELRAQKADEAQADEKRADEKRAEEKRADDEHAEEKQAGEEGAAEGTAVDLNLTVDPTLAADDTALTEAEIATLEAEQAELAGVSTLSTQEEDAEALAALVDQEEQTGNVTEQNDAAVGVTEATIAQTQTASTANTKQASQSTTTNTTNAAESVDTLGDEERKRLNLQTKGGEDTENTGKKTLGQQAADKLASSRTKAGDATTSNETTTDRSGNTPAAVSNLVSSKEAAQVANAAAANSTAGRGSAPTQNFNAFNFDSLAGLGSNQTNTPQNTGAVLIRVGTLPGQTQASQVPNTAIAMQMNKNIQKGVSNFQIRLDPAELGRVDVKMEISTDGRLTAHMVVESAETLDLLRKDAQALEKALSNSGLDMDDEGLTFSLSDEEQQTASQETENGGKNSDSPMSDQEDGSEDDSLSAAPTYYFSNNTSGVDIRV